MQIIHGPYLQNVSRHAITIMWHTDGPATSVVEYAASERLGWSQYVGRPQPAHDRRAEDARLVVIHAVTLPDLDEEQEYYYRVVSTAADGATATSEAASFRTAVREDSPFSFATYGDSMRVHPVHQRNAELVRGYRASLVVGCGDVVQDVIGRYAEDFFLPARSLLPYTPWFAAMGNHDSPNEGYTRYFSYPEPRYWYAFNYGCAHFTVVNSNMDYRPGSEQWHWLEHDLARFSGARWRFVVCHHPPFCSNNVEIPQTRVLCPLFERYAVDIVFTGHATLYERFHPLTAGRYDGERGVIYFVTGGGGYDMSLGPSQLWDHLHPASARARSVNHFLLTTVTPDECRVLAIDNEDHVFDTLVLTRRGGGRESLPPAGLQLPYHALPGAGMAPALRSELALSATKGQAPLTAPGTDPGQSEGRSLAGDEAGWSDWVLPRPQWVADPAFSFDITQDEVDARRRAGQVRSAAARPVGAGSLRWQSEAGRPVFPAMRRVLKDEGRAYDAVAGKAYELSAWVRTQDVSGGVTLSLEWNGDMGFMGRVTSPALAGTNDWTHVSVRVPPMPRYVYACRVLLSALPGSEGAAWFDDVRISTPASFRTEL